jgi:DNA-binding NarL/FixJ family response regulator
MRDPLYKLLLVDNDLLFRLGLRAWLEQFADLEVSAEADTPERALSILAGSAQAEDSENSIRHRPPVAIDLVILGLNLGRNDRARWSDLEFCRQLKSRYPALPILLLGSSQDPAWGAIALHSGVEGYCLKTTAPEELATAIRQVAVGQPYLSDRDSAAPDRIAIMTDETVRVSDVLKHNIRRFGLRQIDSALAQIQAQLENTGTSTVDLLTKAVLAGRIRELSAARWCVDRMGGSSRKMSQPDRPTPLNYPFSVAPDSAGRLVQPDRKSQSLATQNGKDLQPINAMAIQSSLIDATVVKLQDNLSNLSETPLEIDILKDEKKRELLYIILRQLENILSELRFSQIQPPQLLEKKSVILRDLWQNAMTGFLGKYYTLTINGKAEVNVVEVLLQDTEAVEAAILVKIPQVIEFLSHLLFQTALKINNNTYALGTPEAMQRMGILLDNLLIQVANAVVQALLNHFSDFEEIKQKFYPDSLIGSREIERFRNDLSWKYRLEEFVVEPQAIFESRYTLFTLASPGIEKIDIYAPRTQELQRLEGIRLFVTLALELQDATIPRLRSVLSILGRGLVYMLTNVIGRGIGLIGRGILQGMGSAWQEGRGHPR